MPKAFDDAERETIRSAMMTAGLKHFERAGLRAARIDDICRDVGIAKGSFYAFFVSKEDLFMAIVEAREEQHRDDMFAFISAASGTMPHRAGRFFDLLIGKIESDPVLNLLLVSNEIPYLVRKLGAERFEASQQQDRDFAAEAARRWNTAGGGQVSAADLLGLMTIALSLAAQRHQMTTEQYNPTVALLRELFITRLTGSSK
jgi:AcrR family transcriptional regulator